MGAMLATLLSVVNTLNKSALISLSCPKINNIGSWNGASYNDMDREGKRLLISPRNTNRHSKLFSYFKVNLPIGAR